MKFEEIRAKAERGDAEAQFLLGARYYISNGVPRDYKEAAKWFEMAAEQGDAEAQYNLGVLYSQGKGVPQNYVKAHMWFLIADANALKLACDPRGSVAEQMTLEQITEAQRLAKEWIDKHKKSSFLQ